jgi:hypothetical protein
LQTQCQQGFKLKTKDFSEQRKENDETFIVSLANPIGGAQIGSPDTATVTISVGDFFLVETRRRGNAAPTLLPLLTDDASASGLGSHAGAWEPNNLCFVIST